MTRILFILGRLNYSGVAKVLVNMLEALDKSKYECTIAAIFSSGKNTMSVHGDEIKIKTVFKEIPPQEEWKIKLLPDYFWRKKIGYEQYDKIVLYDNCAVTLCGTAFLKKDTCCWLHDNAVYIDGENFSHYKTRKSRITLKKKIKVYENSKRIISVSEDCKKFFTQVWGNCFKTEVLHNIINVKETQRLAETNMPDEMEANCLNLVSVGRLAIEKAFDRQIRGIRYLKKRIPNIRLYIIGTGPEEEKLRKLIDEFNLEENVKLLGLKKNPYPYIKNAHLLVSSSISESYSTVVVEALILGTPVVVTACGGMRDILGNSELGIICENNELALYDSLLSILTDEKLYNLYKSRVMNKSQTISMDDEIRQIEDFLEKDWD